MNKGLAKCLIFSIITLIETMGLGLVISLTTGQTIVAQEVESSFSGSSINGKLDSNSKTINGRYFAFHTFEGKIGEQLTINLVSKEFNGYLILLDPDNNLVARDNGSPSRDNAVITVTLTQAVIYKIAVISNNVGESGNYVLSLVKASEKELALAEAKKLGQQVINLYQQGKYNQAIPLAERALAIRKKYLGNNHPDVGISLNNLALLYKSVGRHTEAEPLYLEDLDISKKQLGDNHPRVATALNNLALLYEFQGRYREAEPFFHQALDILEQNFKEDHSRVADVVNNLAKLYYSQGRYREAKLFFQKALTIFKQNFGDTDFRVAISLNNLTSLYHVQRKYQKAEFFYDRALDILEQNFEDNDLRVATALNNLAVIYRVQEKYKKAEFFYDRALDILEQNFGNNHPSLAFSRNNLALLYRTQGEYKKAEFLYEQALEQNFGNNHPSLAIFLKNQALLYYAENNINQTLESFTKSVKIEEHNLFQNLIVGSESQKRDYIATISGTTNDIISVNLQSASNNSTATRLALNTILQRKGRILDVLTNSHQILRQQINGSTSRDFTLLISLLTRYSNLIFQKPENIKSVDIYRQQLNDLDRQIKKLEDQLSRRSAIFSNLSETITIEKVQKLIPPNSVLVELVHYQPFSSKSTIDEGYSRPHYAVYVLRSEGQPQAIDLGEAEPIDRAVEEFHKHLCTTVEPTPESIKFCIDNLPEAQVKSSAQKLEQMVMQPVRQLLGDTKNILLSPDGKLNLVPFEALVNENNQYLVENYNFTYLTSGRDLIRLQQKSPSEKLPLVIADPLYNLEDNLVTSNLPQRSIENISELFSRNSFPRLEATAKEAQEIQSLLNLPTERIKLQNQASETELKQVESPHLLHIATHGFFLDKPSSNQASQNKITIDNPLFRSGLVLAGVESRPSEVKEGNDGVFTAYEATLLI